MNYKLRTKRAFTLIELTASVGILAMVVLFAGVIFRVTIESHRIAMANAEIMQKLRAITDQLNADFKGLRKEGEIFFAWVASPATPADYDYDNDGHVRFDRILFFADGDFQSYGADPTPLRGNTARISYMLAKRGNDTASIKPPAQPPEKRLLARTQHILTADPRVGVIFDPNTFADPNWYEWNNLFEYEKLSLKAWKDFPFGNKMDMLSVITDITVGTPTVSEGIRGATLDTADANSIHILFCEGVGEFKVQGWYDAQRRWVPEVDPNHDGDLVDSDFFLDPTTGLVDPCAPGVLYPHHPPYRAVRISGIRYPDNLVDESHFNDIPGLGRAFKFTFTLYDSRGVIQKGRTFTHIVYLGN